jgi:hypothetical protein
MARKNGMAQRSRSRTNLAGQAVTAAFLATASPLEGFACGFHDDETLARGIMNWVYPDALHVVGATAAAVAEGRLPPPDGEMGPDPFGTRYRATVRSIERFLEVLSPAAGAPSPNFSLVLVEPMLWTRFEGDQGRLRAQVHVSGPQPGNIVLVSDTNVIRAVADGRLSIGDAHRLGLIRLYGSDDRRAQFLAAHRDAGGAHRSTDRAVTDADTLHIAGGNP